MAKSRMRDRTTILFVRRVRRLILWADSIFGILFVVIQFSKLPFTGIVENGTTPVILWHGGLALYYVSWIAGVGFDLKIQEEVYEKIPTKRGSVPVHGIITVLVIIIVAAALLWTEKYIQKFALVLNCFIVLDHAAWIYIKWFLKEIISASKKEYIQNKLYYDPDFSVL